MADNSTVYYTRGFSVPANIHSVADQVTMTPAVRAFLGTAGAADLERINSTRARGPLKAGEFYTFVADVTNNWPDTAGTVMSVPTLANYASNFGGGRGLSLLLGHEVQMVAGRSYDATVADVLGEGGKPLDNGYGEAVKKLMVKFYMPLGVRLPNGQSTDDVARQVETGVSSDVSLGFCFDRGTCTICNREFLAGCKHMPMLDYDGKTCYVRVMDGKAVEASIVHFHATPQAYIQRAQALAASGDLNASQQRQLEDVYQVRIFNRYAVPSERITPMANEVTNPAPGPQPEATTNPNPIPLIVKGVQERMMAQLDGEAQSQLATVLAQLTGTKQALDEVAEQYWTVSNAINTIMALLGASTQQQTKVAEAAYNGVLTNAFGAKVETRAQAMEQATALKRQLSDLTNQLAGVRSIVGDGDLTTNLRELENRAKQGDAYMGRLLQEAGEAHVRAFNAPAPDFLKRLTINELEQFTTNCDEAAKRNLDPAGQAGKRQTADTPQELPHPTKPNNTPLEAYQVSGSRR